MEHNNNPEAAAKTKAARFGDNAIAAPVCTVLLVVAATVKHSKLMGLLPLGATPGPGAGVNPRTVARLKLGLGITPQAVPGQTHGCQDR
jgi:hypothetical protein